MRKVLLYSLLLVTGLALSQVLPARAGELSDRLRQVVNLLTLVTLSFIMIHVGFEFELDRGRLRSYLADFGVAASAAMLPWIFCSLYFLFAMAPARDFDGWKDSFLTGCFAAPTSAGILFAMLAAAGLSSTWVFAKARVLAIFDDLVTVLLLIPLKMMVVGAHWQLGVIALVIAALLWVAGSFLHRLRIPISWPWILAYSILLVGVSEAVYLASLQIDSVVPIHIEVLLPAFVLGCVLARPTGCDPHIDDAREGHQEGPTSPAEQRVSSFVSGLFMVLVGLSMPPLMSLAASTGWGLIAWHTLAITLLSNAGKMFPLLCYRGVAGFKERLALCLGMWPRGEVGAGVLILSLGYGIGGAPVAVATLSLAINLVGTGLFIAAVKKLLRSTS
jgi:Kef-type K+ transport system membrane component KefB